MNRDDTFPGLSEERCADLLADAIGAFMAVDGRRMRIRSYADAGLATRNTGIVVQIEDAEFKVEIVRSRT
jgi:hypothetical protein